MPARRLKTALVSLIAAAPVPARLRLRACKWLVLQNLSHRAVPVLERMEHHPTAASHARRLLAVARYSDATLASLDLENRARRDPRWESLDGPIGPSSDETGLLVWARSGSERVVIAFSNINGGYGPPRGLTSVALMHRVLGSLPASVVYVRDPNRCFSLGGVQGLGPDYRTCLEGLRELCRRKGWREIFTMGPSGGGYAALRFGLDLQARAVLSLSGPTSAAFPDRRGFREVNRIAPEMAVDLVPLYRDSERRPRLLLHYGELNKWDASMAHRMAEFPEAELMPAPGYDAHSTLHLVLREQSLEQLVGRLLSHG